MGLTFAVAMPPVEFPIDLQATAAVIGVAGGIIFLIWGGIRVAFAFLDKRFWMGLGLTTPIDGSRRHEASGAQSSPPAPSPPPGGGVQPPPDGGIIGGAFGPGGGR